VVDGWFYQFYQSPRYYLSIDRRHNLLFRFHPGVRWEGAVHERVVNLRGRRLAMPYRYFHYGYVATADHVRGRWDQYGTLGDAVSGGQASRVEEIFASDARRARRYAGRHPAPVRPLLDAYEHAHGEAIQRFDRDAEAGRSWRTRLTAFRDRVSPALARMAWRIGPPGRRATALRGAVGRLVACERALQAGQ